MVRCCPGSGLVQGRTKADEGPEGSPEQERRTATRLLGAGRLAIEVPTGWPVEVGAAQVVLLDSGDEVVEVAGVRHAPDGSATHAVIGLSAPTLGGRFTICGPADDVERIVLDGTQPTGGTVLPLGSTVTARLVRAR